MNKQIINQNWALLITRVIVGVIFVYSGWLKVADMGATVGMFGQMGIPSFLAYIVSYGEIIAGLLLILGLWTMCASLFLIVVMVVAVFLTRSMGFQMYSLPLITLAGLIAIHGNGAGRYKVNLKK
jgi:putative oxidoreductase